MSDPRRIDQILAELDALRREVMDLKRRKVNSWVQNGKGGGDAILAVTPTGGIAAMTDTTFPLAFTSATCFRVDPDTGEYFDPTEEVIIYNMVSVAIAGEVLIQAKKIGTRWFVDVDNCASSTVDLPETAEPPPPA